MIKLSQRAQNISPSPTLAITAKAKAMKAEGIDVISFGAGEPDFDTPQYIKDAAKAAIDNGLTKYTPTSGMPELKKAICAKFANDNGLQYDPENILVSNGAKQCLYNIIQVLIDPDDEVIIPKPYWVSYEEMVKLAGGKCIPLETEDFLLSAQNFEDAITPRTKLLLLTSPSNPTGAVYSKQELQKIADVCVKHNILVISDEIYEKLIYEGQHISIASLGEKIKMQTIVVNGVSKSYAMTGWRIGYCAGDSQIIAAASNLQDHSTSNTNSIAQAAAIAALEHDDGSTEQMRREFAKRRELMVKLANEIPGFRTKSPAGAFYLFVDISQACKGRFKGTDEFCQELLEKSQVAAIPGSAFGDDRYIRLSFATSEENIKKGLKRIKEFVEASY